MKQILQNLKTGRIELAEIPTPALMRGYILARTTKSLISLGTERMLLEFGRAGWLNKARQQPDKVRQVVEKIKTDGLTSTVQAVLNKLDQPIPLGYSNVGVIEELGPGARGFSKGERVVSNGAHAQAVAVPENLCAKIPDSVDDVTASFTVVSAIALQGVRLANPTLGESVAVIGLGLIGLLTCQILKANGCRVIGFDFEGHKVAVAREFGAEAYDLSTGVDPVVAVTAFSQGYGVDAVLITASTRSNEPMLQAPKMCRKKGRVVLIGVVGLELSRDEFYEKEISFTVSCSYGPGRYENGYEKQGLDYPIGYVRWTEQRNFEAVLQLMAEGKIVTAPLVDEVVPFLQASQVYEKISGRSKSLGIVLDYGGADEALKNVVTVSDVRRSNRKGLRGKPVVGLIGAGNYALATLLPILSKTGVELRAIASSQGISGSHAARKYGIALNTTDYRTILDDPEINTVIITTRHNSHGGIVLDALKARKHVFVEKPLCLSLDELARIIEEFETTPEKNPLLMVGLNRRFAPLITKVKSLIDNMNEPKCFIMTVNAGAVPSDHWIQDPKVGGGRIVGEACHFVDLLRYLVGYPIVSHSLICTGVDTEALIRSDKATMSLRFQDGSIGTIHYFANGHRSFSKERLEIFGADKIIQLDNFRRLTGFGWKKFGFKRTLGQDKGHEACIRAFLDAIENGSPSPISFDELVEVARVSIEAQRCARGQADNRL